MKFLRVHYSGILKVPWYLENRTQNFGRPKLKKIGLKYLIFFNLDKIWVNDKFGWDLNVSALQITDPENLLTVGVLLKNFIINVIFSVDGYNYIDKGPCIDDFWKHIYILKSFRINFFCFLLNWFWLNLNDLPGSRKTSSLTSHWDPTATSTEISPGSSDVSWRLAVLTKLSHLNSRQFPISHFSVERNSST